MAIWLPSACHMMYSAHAYKTIKWRQIELQADRVCTVYRFRVHFYSYKDDMMPCALENAVLLCQNHDDYLSWFWASLAEEERKKKMNNLIVWLPSEFLLYRRFLATLGVFLVQKPWRLGAYESLDVIFWRDLEGLILYCVYGVSVPSLHGVSTDSLIPYNWRALSLAEKP